MRSARILRNGLIGGVMALLVVGQAAAVPRLTGPVDVPARRALFNRPTTPVPCVNPPPMPNVLTSTSFYTDPPHYSKVDPQKAKQFQAEMASVRIAEEALARTMSAFVKADANHAPAYGQCALGLILRFASDKAMIGSTEMRNTGYVRLLSSSPVFAYTLLKGNAAIPSDKAAAIEGWIRQVANTVLLGQQKYRYGNNIDIWGAATLAAASVATQDPALLDKAVAVANTTLAQVSPDGLLPQEMTRGERALEYNLFATQALATIQAIARRNRSALRTPLDEAALGRLMAGMLHAVTQPDWFAALAGNPASVAADKVYQENLGWLALLAEQGQDARLTAVYCKYQPFNVWRAGGEWSALFGPQIRCSP